MAKNNIQFDIYSMNYIDMSNFIHCLHVEREAGEGDELWVRQSYFMIRYLFL